MQHPRPRSLPIRSLAFQASAVLLASMAAAYWWGPLATAPAPRPHASLASRWSGSGMAPADSTAASCDEQALREQVQALLAQGGCPGWIELAGEPHPFAGPAPTPSRVYPDHIRPTAATVAGAPAASADDELISEQDDLLFTSPGIQTPSGELPKSLPTVEEPAATPQETAPSESAASEEPKAPSVPTREFTPQELLEEKPLAEEKAPPAPPVSSPETWPNDDLLDGQPDLLRESIPPIVTPSAEAPEALPPPTRELLQDRGDLLAPVAPPAPPQPAPPMASPFMPPPSGVPPLHRSPGPTLPPPDADASQTDPAEDAESRCQFIADSQYPAATACRVCHEKLYEEWSVSSHAYAAVSPMFHKFEQKINDLSQGTIGYFCFRCHSPAGTALGVSRAAALWDMPAVAREGVTCVACHRVREMYGKTNGERHIEPGDIYAPVYGSIGGDGVAAAIAQKDQFKVKISPDEKGPGQPMHSAGFCFPQLAKSEFCTSCHQVAVYPGIKLEVVWEQYRASPACKKGISCQDCHMGRIPGVPSGHEIGPAAEINKKNVNANRKHANHTFYGPGYSIAHPGLFPMNPKADRWSVRDWLLFDWRAGWGTDAFEDAVDDGLVQCAFPEVWKESDDRCDAREIIDANLKKKQAKDALRVQVMENGSAINGPFFDGPQTQGVDLNFHYDVRNTNDGHNLPTGSLGAQPQLWANVVLIGPSGERLWETGYLDTLGDLADIHSDDVRHKRAPFDWQLFNLQSMFLITGAKGTDREFYLPLNVDIDPLPFIRPAPQPVSVINHPPFIRMEARSLAPLGTRRVPYRIPGHLLQAPGRYRLSFRMRMRTEPMYFMRFCESTPEMQRAMIEGTLDFHQSSVEFDVR